MSGKFDAAIEHLRMKWLTESTAYGNKDIAESCRVGLRVLEAAANHIRSIEGHYATQMGQIWTSSEQRAILKAVDAALPDDTDAKEKK